MAKEFLRRGFKVIISSRNAEKLENVKKEFKELFPNSEIEIIVADFSYSHRDPIRFYENLFNEIKGFNISVLVNNVGIADAHLLLNQPLDDIEKSIGINIYPSTMLLHMLIPSFLKRFDSSKMRSLVINFSSTMEETVTPGSIVYAATKRYNAFLSEGLRYEYDNIDFVTVKPGPVQTQLHLKNVKGGFPLCPDPDQYAQALLGGLRTGINHGHWKSKIWGLMASLPYLVNIIIVRMTMPSVDKQGLLR